jgi:tetratricopeptide (TPR) repeat protein
MLWVSERDAHTDAFNPAGGPALSGPVTVLTLPTEVTAALTILMGLHAAPGATAATDLASACDAVAAWAASQEHLATELAFVQAAALLSPADPSLAYRVGRLARERAEFPRAETWFRTAIRLARHSDWDTYTLSYIALANLYTSVGNYPAARELSLLALRTSTRRGFPAYAGMAAHALFIVSAETNQIKEATAYALQAFRAYGHQQPIVASLAHDVGCFWMNRGQVARALPVFEAMLPHMPKLEHYIAGLSNTARASAILGDIVRYERRWMDTMNAIPACRSECHVAEALLTLTRASVAARQFDRAEQTATRALIIAGRSGMAQLQLQIEAVLGESKAEATLSRPQPVESPSSRQQAERLAVDLVDLLGSVPAVSAMPSP